VVPAAAAVHLVLIRVVQVAAEITSVEPLEHLVKDIKAVVAELLLHIMAAVAAVLDKQVEILIPMERETVTVVLDYRRQLLEHR
jgi:hypothetical protein